MDVQTFTYQKTLKLRVKPLSTWMSGRSYKKMSLGLKSCRHGCPDIHIPKGIEDQA